MELDGTALRRQSFRTCSNHFWLNICSQRWILAPSSEVGQGMSVCVARRCHVRASGTVQNPPGTRQTERTEGNCGRQCRDAPRFSHAEMQGPMQTSKGCLEVALLDRKSVV